MKFVADQLAAAAQAEAQQQQQGVYGRIYGVESRM